MKKLVICLLLTLFVNNYILAANAYPFPITYNQADGTTVTVRLHGTEDFHYMTTLDGTLVVRTGKGIYVARITENNTLEATNVLAHNAGERTAEELALASAQDKKGFIQRGMEQQEIMLAKPVLPEGTTPKLYPHLGTPKVLVMLVDFTDKSFSVADPLKNFDQYLNKEGHGKGVMQDFYDEKGVTHSESRLYGSVAEYFDCMSYGQFRPQFEIVPNIIHLNNKVSYYGDKENMNAFVKDACTIAKNSYNVDFSKYDSDNDGYCDLIYFIYAGQGENSGGAYETIWAKSGTVSSFTMDGKKICRYGVSCELSITDKYINGIGVFCHEFSHTMGLPDFYNTTSNAPDPNQGMEYWSLMDWGMYLNDGTGRLPVPYTAWERYYMDWIDIPTIKANDHYTLYPCYDDKHNAFIIENPENDNEYFVLENVNKSDWGTGMLGQGLQVTHVNFESSYFSISTNRVNSVIKRPRMSIVPADGELYSTYNEEATFNILKEKAAGDLFSQANGYTELSRENNLPNFDWFTNAGNKSVSSTSATYPNNSKIYNIKENEDGSIEFDVILDVTTGLNNIITDSKKSDKIFNLNGQEVGKNYRGIIIKNGKKIIR